MEIRKILALLVLALTATLWTPTSARAAPLGTAFTYQGRLIHANYPADGPYDFQFRLFNAISDGNQVGSDVNKPDVDVIHGYFTVKLDFGSVFDSNEVWLEAGVRPGDLNDPNTYDVLSPRQLLTPTPHALYAASGPPLQPPLSLMGSTSQPLIEATNTGTGPAVKGTNFTTGSYGYLGGDLTGLYAEGSTYAGYFQGDVKVSGLGRGIIFADGTKQTTASIDTTVPSGCHIFGDTWTPPPGYSYTGHRLLAEGTDTWDPMASMITARSSLAAAVANNKIYAIGGMNSYSSYLHKNEEYDPLSDTWAAKADMPTPRRDFALAAVNNKVYAIGGQSSLYYPAVPKTEQYDPALNTWTTKTDIPTPRMSVAAAVVDGKIYVIGGHDGTSQSTKNEVYDTSTEKWATRADMPTARSGLVAVTVNGRIYAIGGYDGSSQVSANEEYDPLADKWNSKADMPTARYSLAAAVLDGKVYAIGGYTRDGFTQLAANEQYDPAADTWTEKVGMPTPRFRLAAATVADKIYAIGGDDGPSYLDTNEEYKCTNPPKYYYIHRKD